MFRRWTLVAALAGSALAGCGHDETVAPADGEGALLAQWSSAGGRRSFAPVVRFDDGSEVGKSSIVRFPNAVHTAINAGGLVPGHATTIWLNIFNAPENCAGEPCVEEDLFDLATQPDAVWAGGGIVDASGHVQLVGRVRKGDLSGSTNPPFGFPPIALTNPLGAELHLVVRVHGPVIPGLEEEMTTTFGGGCNDAPPGLGTPGPNTCELVYTSVHPRP